MIRDTSLKYTINEIEREKNSKKKKTSLIGKIFITLFMLVLLAGIGVTGALAYFYNSVRHEVEGIIAHTVERSSMIYDRNGKKIANLLADEFRLYAPFDEIPPRIIETLLATEDTSFFEHPGINVDAIFRAGIKDVLTMSKAEGASTITQQLVKNAVLTKEKKIERKLKEIFLSFELEKHLSKKDILEKYLNMIYFGSGFHGIKTASWGYFKKDLNALTLKETAMLIGLIKAPSFYDPTRKYDYSIGRANRVLSRMYEELGWISKDDYEKAIEERPVATRGSKTENTLAPYAVDYLMKGLSERYEDIKTGGYSIETTIDLDIQELAQKSLQNGYDILVKQMKKDKYSQDRIDKLNGAMIVLNQKTGEILAMVGGVDYKKSPFNRVTSGLRQVGSSIKPLFYQIGLNMGYSGASILNDVQKTYEFKAGNGKIQKWTPQNYTKKAQGQVRLRDALANSRNLATLDLFDKLGASNLFKEIKRFGFNDISNDLSNALGSYSTSMINLARVYTVISNYGKRVDPFVIKTIKKDNKIIEETHTSSEELFSDSQAYLMIDILKYAVQKGTGTKAFNSQIELAGKTGTTDNGRDIWFNVFSPDIQVHIWFGNDDNSPILDNDISGGGFAAPVAGEFFTALLTTKAIETTFKIPEGVKRYRFDGDFECFTDISKPPAVTKSTFEDESLLF